MIRSDKTRLVYEVKWVELKSTKKRGSEELKRSLHFDRSDSVAQGHAIKISKLESCVNKIAQVGQWQVGDGPTDLLIQTWTYEDGKFKEHHMESREGKIITRPTTDPALSAVEGTARETFPELPDSLNRKLNGIKHQVLTHNGSNQTKETTMTAIAKKSTTSTASKKAVAAKAVAKAGAAKGRKEAPKAKKAAAKEPAKPFVGKAPKAGASKLLESFGVLREGSNKEKLVSFLVKNAGKALPITAALKAVYGSANLDNSGALQMVIAGGRVAIEKSKAPLQIALHANDKGERCIGLYQA